ncbi:MAG: hypothetical protein KC457_34680, partial [Myxococcales bacterium]|nr:hypothetical protein [Myxococcales bacterium]
MARPEFTELSTSLAGTHAPVQPRIHRQEQAPVELPPLDDLLVRIGELSELLDPGHCATAYQLYAPEDLPDAYDDTLVAQRTLLRRLLRYAGEDDDSLGLELIDGREAVDDDFASHLAGSLAYAGLVGSSDDQAPPRLRIIAVDLGDKRAMLGPSCVELGRGLVHLARLEAAGTGYRGGQRGDEELPSELDGFLASFALGWGLLVTNACLDPRSVGANVGNWAGAAWVSASLNYPPKLAVEILAAIYRAGGRDQA